MLTQALLDQMNALSTEDARRLQMCMNVKLNTVYRVSHFYEAEETISVMVALKDFLGTNYEGAELLMETESCVLHVETERQRLLLQQIILQGCTVTVLY